MRASFSLYTRRYYQQHGGSSGWIVGQDGTFKSNFYNFLVSHRAAVSSAQTAQDSWTFPPNDGGVAVTIGHTVNISWKSDLQFKLMYKINL